jgi:hypothetical protein
MEAMVIEGQLTYINTDQGEIHITDKDDGKYTLLNITTDTQIPLAEWEDIIGRDVEAIVIDDEVRNIVLISRE